MTYIDIFVQIVTIHSEPWRQQNLIEQSIMEI